VTGSPTHHYVVFPKPQILNDLHPFDRVNLGMEVAQHSHLFLRQVIGKVLGHPLGERRDDNPLDLSNTHLRLTEQFKVCSAMESR